MKLEKHIARIVETRFRCMGAPLCDWSERRAMVPHNNACPASKKHRATQVAYDVLGKSAKLRSMR